MHVDRAGPVDIKMYQIKSSYNIKIEAIIEFFLFRLLMLSLFIDLLSLNVIVNHVF